MNPLRFSALVFLVVAACLAQTGGHGQGHIMITPAQVKWGPGPPSLPPGAQAAVLSGDPSQPGASYTIRVKAPDNYAVPAHWHPVDENVIVLMGTMMIGMGNKMDRTSAHALTVGSFMKMPKEVRHYAWVRGETIFDVYGVGPFDITYVSPADDPRKKAPAKK